MTINRHGSIGRLLDRRMPLLGEIVVGLAAVGFAAISRLIVESVVTGAIPFVLTYPAVIAAGLIGGLWAGLLATMGCELLIWYFILPPEHSFAMMNSGQVVTVVLTTLTQIIVVWAVSAHRALYRQLRDESERQVELLSIALTEIDHRTKNNFQVAASLLTARAIMVDEPRASQELRLAASRLITIAGTYRNLAVNSANLSDVLLHNHLREICDRLRDGILPGTVGLAFSAEPVTVDARVAVAAGLIVNEWITNAAKHAFPQAIGQITVRASSDDGCLKVTVADNGTGRAPSPRGQGTELTALIAQSVDADIAVTEDGGTHCLLTLSLQDEPR